MKLLELIPLRRFYVHATCFLLGILLAFSFEPFKVPFLSLIAIGTYFLINNYIFENFKRYYKIFFLTVFTLVLVFFY